jgi:N-acetylornithine carbamoyltransferase
LPDAPALRHLTSWLDAPDGVWDRCLSRALHHGAHPGWPRTAPDKALGLVFMAPSLRTRASMEGAAARLGAHAAVLTPGQGTWGLEHRANVKMDGVAAEHVREAAGVLSQYYDALGVRTFATLTDRLSDRADAVFDAFVQSATVPVVSLESARWHPCQALADAAALRVHYGKELKGRKFVLQWAPHPKALPRAVPNSALLMAARLGFDVTVARPDGFALEPDVMAAARETAARSGGSVSETDQVDAAAEGAHVVYAKAWSGAAVYDDPDAEAAARAKHAKWTVTERRMDRTDEAAFMHCLPVRRGVVVEDAVLDGPNALHLRQAAFRLHAQMAILEWVWNLNKG